MSKLRNEVIRLAHSKPELRGQLLPVLKESGDKAKTEEGAKKLYQKYLDGLENPSKSTKKPQDFYEKPSEEKGKSESGGDKKEIEAEIKKLEKTLSDLEDEYDERFFLERDLEELSLNEDFRDEYGGAEKDIIGSFESYLGPDHKGKGISYWMKEYGDKEDTDKVEDLMSVFNGSVGRFHNDDLTTVEAIEFFESGDAKKAVDAISKALKKLDDGSGYAKGKTDKIDKLFKAVKRDVDNTKEWEYDEKKGALAKMDKAEKELADAQKSLKELGKGKEAKLSGTLLRNQAIKLAYENPELREHILPLLRED